jgi:hypothetical protein
MDINKIRLPTPRINLSGCEDIRLEMCRVYRDARLGVLATGDATKLVFILSQILKAFELIEFDNRLKVIEGISKDAIKP